MSLILMQDDCDVAPTELDHQAKKNTQQLNEKRCVVLIYRSLGEVLSEKNPGLARKLKIQHGHFPQIFPI